MQNQTTCPHCGKPKLKTPLYVISIFTVILFFVSFIIPPMAVFFVIGFIALPIIIIKNWFKPSPEKICISCWKKIPLESTIKKKATKAINEDEALFEVKISTSSGKDYKETSKEANQTLALVQVNDLFKDLDLSTPVAKFESKYPHNSKTGKKVILCVSCKAPFKKIPLGKTHCKECGEETYVIKSKWDGKMFWTDFYEYEMLKITNHRYESIKNFYLYNAAYKGLSAKQIVAKFEKKLNQALARGKYWEVRNVLYEMQYFFKAFEANESLLKTEEYLEKLDNLRDDY